MSETVCTRDGAVRNPMFDVDKVLIVKVNPVTKVREIVWHGNLCENCLVGLIAGLEPD